MSTETSLDRDMLDALSRKPSNDQFKPQMGTLDRIRQDGERHSGTHEVILNEILVESQVRQQPVHEDAVLNLAQSMESVGLLQPITVSPLPDQQRRETKRKYRLEVGETRLRAASILGWQRIAANVVERPNDLDRMQRQLIENIQRNNLNPIEVAECIKAIKIQSKLAGKSLTYTRIAEDLGMTSSNVSEYIALLKLSEPVRDLILNEQLKDRRAAVLLDEISTLDTVQGKKLIGQFMNGDGASRSELKKYLQRLKEQPSSSTPIHTQEQVRQQHYERQPAIKAEPVQVEYQVEGKLISGETVKGILLQGWLDTNAENQASNTFWVRLPDGQTVALEKITGLSQRWCRNNR
ncbi:ParB/RepB/Spo0J family partition protein [Pseudidiomarina sp.]|uniref:ParB/RepB/Spo0J family partition protein n=1 Tax=Pseudidiomarina sp. TaxID=2081707 RepID=UPI003A96BA4C